MTDQNVINLLLQHVRDSSGTAKYLEIMRKIIDSYMDQSLKPLRFGMLSLCFEFGEILLFPKSR